MSTALEKRDDAATSIRAFEAVLGGRKGVVEALALSPARAVQDLVSMLQDPAYDDYPLTRIADSAKLDLGLLIRALRDGTLVRAQIEASRRVAQRLNDIVDDILRRAVPYEDRCTDCRGTGTKTGNPCTACDGTGTVAKQPTLEYQKLVLQLGELIKPKDTGGPSILNQQINVGDPHPAPSLSLEQLQQSVADLLAQPVILEADVTDA